VVPGTEKEEYMRPLNDWVSKSIPRVQKWYETILVRASFFFVTFNIHSSNPDRDYSDGCVE
jgi:hypothetical protein